MAPVPPRRSKVPVLLGGPHAVAIERVLADLGFAVSVADARFGVASATKMCRSVVIKGLEAILIEGLTAARHYGVESAVIASLRETLPDIDWEHQATYCFERVIEHGRRRSEEMREAAATVQEAGLTPWSAAGTEQRQAWLAELAEQGLFGELKCGGFAESIQFRSAADRILSHLRKTRRSSGAR